MGSVPEPLIVDARSALLEVADDEAWNQVGSEVIERASLEGEARGALKRTRPDLAEHHLIERRVRVAGHRRDAAVKHLHPREPLPSCLLVLRRDPNPRVVLTFLRERHVVTDSKTYRSSPR